jgi:hypothetical protein
LRVAVRGRRSGIEFVVAQMTGCARARGDRDTLCVDGDTSPGARLIGGRSVDVLIAAGVDASMILAGNSKLL